MAQVRRLLDRPDQVDYQVRRSNEAWPDHRARTLVTAALITWLRPKSVVDPACGDGSIVVAADRMSLIRDVTLGDVSAPNIERLSKSAKRYGWTFRAGTVGQTLYATSWSDVVVLTEILEHLPDPDAVLRAAKDKATYLIASSPEMRPGQEDGNPEHLWQFDREGYRAMLEGAGWTVQQYTHLQFMSDYDFGIWVCA